MIYFVQRANQDIKIGTTENFTNRKRTLSTRHGPLELLGVMAGGRRQETLLHAQFAESRKTPREEWFAPTSDLLRFIREETTLELPNDDQTVTVAVTPELRQALLLLKEVYETKTVARAVAAFLDVHDPDLAAMARRRVTELQAMRRRQSPDGGTYDVG